MKLINGNNKRKAGSILILIILVCSGLLVINYNSNQADAASVWKQQSDIDFENGTLNDISITGFGDFSQLVLNNNYDWTEKLPPINTNPMARNGHDMASIDGDDKVVLFGGGWGSAETWVYDLSDNNWTEKTPATGPDIRKDHAMASVDGTDNVIFFGGWNGTVLKNDTWVYDLSSNTWTQKFPANPPDIRLWHSMATIYGTDKVLLFGGYNYTNGLGDTWE
jgi:hypothetical protein